MVAALALQLQVPLWQLRTADTWGTQPSFYAPALALAARYYDADHRFHVVVPEGHWEAYYFPAAGFPITRGWFRQDDALHNRALYDPDLTPACYTRWLRQLGVRYVFVPHAPIVASSQAEVSLLETSRAFDLVSYDQSWAVYRLRRSKPIVEPLAAHSAAHVLRLDHATVRFKASRAGRYRVRLTESPHWTLLRSGTVAPGSHLSSTQGADRLRCVSVGRLRSTSHRMMVVEVPAAGVYTLSFDPGGAFADKLGSLTRQGS